MVRNVMFVEIYKIYLRLGYFMVLVNKVDGRFYFFGWVWDKVVSLWS